MSFRLLALDLDGTLLDPAAELTAAAHDAVAAARRAGLLVVLCTGRRFRTALPVLRELELGGRVVVNNGAVVKEVATAATVHRNYLDPDVYPEALGVMTGAGTPLVYVDAYQEDTDILTQTRPDPHPFQLDYVEDHAAHIRFVPDLAATRREDVIMLSMMADLATLEELRERGRRELGDRVSTHMIHNKNYRGHILEFFSPRSGKWAALEQVAADAGISPAEIAAVGDDANDAELLRRSGLGIAMGNAVPEAAESADLQVASNAEEGIVEAIERVLRET